MARLHPCSIVRVSAALLTMCLLGVGCASSKQTEFASPESAVQSFVGAVRADDDATLKKMFGPQADELMASGDPIADKNRRAKFLAAYDEKNQIVPGEDEYSRTLVVGAQDWPLPIPIVQDEKSGQWRFDTEAGKEEIINRRIGRNELDVIQVCKAFVDAEQEYAERDPDGNDIPDYAQKTISDPGKRNGLYYETKEDEPPSPLGPFVAEATEEGYAMSGSSSGTSRPYHGYRYHLLKAQGNNAPGGAKEYVVNGLMIGGFAAVAWPADYGNSGIMTFIVSRDGIVYQKDLGNHTDRLAREMTKFDPGPDWKKVEAADADAPQ